MNPTQHYTYDESTNLVRCIGNKTKNNAMRHYQPVCATSNRPQAQAYDGAGNQQHSDAQSGWLYHADGALAQLSWQAEGYQYQEYYTYAQPGVRARKVTEVRSLDSNVLMGLAVVNYLGEVEFQAMYEGTHLSYDGDIVTDENGVEVAPTSQRTITRIKDGHGQVGKLDKNELTGQQRLSYNALNHIDSNELALDEAGNLSHYRSYAPYGETVEEVQADDSNPSELGYSGQEHDDSGLVYYGHRYLQTENGIWNRADPIRFASGQLNLYSLLAGNPVSGRDVGGMGKQPLFKIGSTNQRYRLLPGLNRREKQRKKKKRHSKDKKDKRVMDDLRKLDATDLFKVLIKSTKTEEKRKLSSVQEKLLVTGFLRELVGEAKESWRDSAYESQPGYITHPTVLDKYVITERKAYKSGQQLGFNRFVDALVAAHYGIDNSQQDALGLDAWLLPGDEIHYQKIGELGIKNFIVGDKHEEVSTTSNALIITNSLQKSVGSKEIMFAKEFTDIDMHHNPTFRSYDELGFDPKDGAFHFENLENPNDQEMKNMVLYGGLHGLHKEGVEVVYMGHNGHAHTATQFLEGLKHDKIFIAFLGAAHIINFENAPYEEVLLRDDFPHPVDSYNLYMNELDYDTAFVWLDQNYGNKEAMLFEQTGDYYKLGDYELDKGGKRKKLLHEKANIGEGFKFKPEHNGEHFRIAHVGKRKLLLQPPKFPQQVHATVLKRYTNPFKSVKTPIIEQPQMHQPQRFVRISQAIGATNEPFIRQRYSQIEEVLDREDSPSLWGGLNTYEPFRRQRYHHIEEASDREDSPSLAKLGGGLKL